MGILVGWQFIAVIISQQLFMTLLLHAQHSVGSEGAGPVLIELAVWWGGQTSVQKLSREMGTSPNLVGDGGAQVQAGYRRKQMEGSGRLGEGCRVGFGGVCIGGRLLIC